MNRRRQPFFFALLLALVACASANPASPSIAHISVLLARVSYNSASIVLAAAPFVLAGALGAFVVESLRLRGVPALFAAVLAPGCDCSMNGFASAFAGSPPRLAAAALVWGAACNPIALVTTAAVLGPHLLFARVLGAAVDVLGIWALWNSPPLTAAHAAACSLRCGDTTQRGSGDATRLWKFCDVAANAERGLRALLPAALIGGAVPVLVATRLHVVTSPFVAALIGASLSPCSTADPVLANVFARVAPAQAAFMLASQCLDVRMLWLIARFFGGRRMLLAATAGVFGCAAAALVAR